MARCAAGGCWNNKRDGGKISFFKFPADPQLKEAWVDRIQREEHFKPSDCSVLCSEHFEEECFTYQNFTNRRGLKKGAIPTKFSSTKENNINIMEDAIRMVLQQETPEDGEGGQIKDGEEHNDTAMDDNDWKEKKMDPDETDTLVCEPDITSYFPDKLTSHMLCDARSKLSSMQAELSELGWQETQIRRQLLKYKRVETQDNASDTEKESLLASLQSQLNNLIEEKMDLLKKLKSSEKQVHELYESEDIGESGPPPRKKKKTILIIKQRQNAEGECEKKETAISKELLERIERRDPSIPIHSLLLPTKPKQSPTKKLSAKVQKTYSKLDRKITETPVSNPTSSHMSKELNSISTESIQQPQEQPNAITSVILNNLQTNINAPASVNFNNLQTNINAPASVNLNKNINAPASLNLNNLQTNINAPASVIFNNLRTDINLPVPAFPTTSQIAFVPPFFLCVNNSQPNSVFPSVPVFPTNSQPNVVSSAVVFPTNSQSNVVSSVVGSTGSNGLLLPTKSQPEVPSSSSAFTDKSKSGAQCKFKYRRMVNIGYFVKSLQQLNSHSNLGCNFSNMDVIAELSKEWNAGIMFKCRSCNFSKVVWTEDPNNPPPGVDVQASENIGCNTTLSKDKPDSPNHIGQAKKVGHINKFKDNTDSPPLSPSEPVPSNFKIQTKNNFDSSTSLSKDELVLPIDITQAKDPIQTIKSVQSPTTNKKTTLLDEGLSINQSHNSLKGQLQNGHMIDQSNVCIPQENIVPADDVVKVELSFCVDQPNADKDSTSVPLDCTENSSLNTFDANTFEGSQMLSGSNNDANGTSVMPMIVHVSPVDLNLVKKEKDDDIT